MVKKINICSILLFSAIFLVEGSLCYAAEGSSTITRESIAEEYKNDEQFQMMLDDYGVE